MKIYLDIEKKFLKGKQINDIEIVRTTSVNKKNKLQDDGFTLVKTVSCDCKDFFGQLIPDVVFYTLIKIKDPDHNNELEKEFEKCKIELKNLYKLYTDEKSKRKKFEKSINGYKGQNTKLHNRINKLTKNKK